MRACYLIPLAAFLSGCQSYWHWQYPPTAASPPMAVAPVVVQPQPLAPQPPAPPVNLLPQPPGTIPPVATTAPPPRLSGPISPKFGLPTGPVAPAALLNPMHVPLANDEVAWEEIADVVSDYFQIANEQRARRTPEFASLGFIVSAPLTGASVLEPQRGDSADSFNRWQSTFQTIRRRATVTVEPDAGGYLVGVQVDKELEDLPRPEQATAGQAILRNDSSLPDRESFEVSSTRPSARWIYLGRDVVLEQQMLSDIQARFGAVQPAGFLPQR